MAQEQPPPSGDASFRAAVVRHAVSGVGLIVLVAALFWLIGSFGRDDGEPEIADGPMTEVGRELAEQTEADETADTDGADDGDGLEATETSEDGSTDDGPTDDGDEPDAQDETGDDEVDPGPPAIDPATISVQVLDGYQQDGGTAANAVADLLSGEGYDIVARNPAIRYDVTTVLWTEGFEDEGRQVAAAIDAAEAREQPGNLSQSVAVHVVVGADRG